MPTGPQIPTLYSPFMCWTPYGSKSTVLLGLCAVLGEPM
jgi:hypothetical protein